jgi:nucleoside-diphosphate-sugar epimerase
MKVLILGGNRFVGKILAEMLVWHDKKNEVDIFNRSGTGPWVTGKIKGNRNHEKDLNKIDFNKYDIVVDMCLYNMTQVKKIFPLIKNSTIKQYIFMSSMDSVFKVYEGYGEKKADIENYLIQSTVPWVILRPTYILGIGNPHYREAYFFDKILKKEIIEIDGDGIKQLSFVSANDVARCIYKIIENKTTNQIYNLCSDDKVNLIELTNIFFKIVGEKTHLRFARIGGPFPNKDFFLSNKKFKKQFNFRFTSLEKILIDFYNWYGN